MTSIRILLILTCLANIALAFGSLPWLPNPMPVHFSLDGTPNQFGSPLTGAINLSVGSVFMTLFVFFTSWIISVVPVSLINMPNKNYWMNEENRPKTIRRVRAYVEWIGAATLFLLLLTQCEVIRVATSISQKGSFAVLLAEFVLVVLLIFGPTVYLLWSFRLPKNP